MTGGAEARDKPRVRILVGDHGDHVQYGLFGVAGCPQPLQVSSLHPPGLAAELSGEADQSVITVLNGLESAEGLGAFPICGLFGGNKGQELA